MRAFPLVGYFPKKVVARPDWLKAPRVLAIRSVSDCISEGPDGWIDHGKNNDLGFFATEADAWSVVPDGERGQFEIHAYRMLPATFDGGARRPFDVPGLNNGSLPAEYRSIGFDVVSRSASSFFECSPLSCNNMAEEIETNMHCLLTDVETAAHIAMRFSQEDLEPGPYCVLEVFRR